MQSLNSNPFYRLFFPKVLRTYLWKKYLKKKITKVYNHSNDKELIDILNNININGVKIISSTLTKKYNKNKIKVLYDKKLNLKYVNYKKDKPIYFKKKWSKSRIQKALNQLYIEQDPNSPHRYLTENFNVDEKTVVADIGCAEANFSLDIIDKVKHIYLFETNNVWEEPLKATFKKYKDKITIVNKKFSNTDSKNSVDGSKFLKNKGVNFLKIDVDGYEDEVMSNLEELIAESKKMKIALCTYHSNDDYKKYSTLLKKYNYSISNSNGYMIFYWDKKLDKPYLRRGVLRAEKNF
jgi:hypothetical protein|tara:strand:- start:105 stop:986 length:882 start_codon:yes stop_codon:yes gene_type:complete